MPSFCEYNGIVVEEEAPVIEGAPDEDLAGDERRSRRSLNFAKRQGRRAQRKLQSVDHNAQIAEEMML